MSEPQAKPKRDISILVKNIDLVAFAIMLLGVMFGQIINSFWVSVVLVLIGIVLGAFGFLLGVVTLVFAWKKVCKRISIMSWSILGVLPLSILLMLPPLGTSRPLARHSMSMTNLDMIGKGFVLYESNYDAYPDRLEQLVTAGYASPKSFQNPMGKDKVEINSAGEFVGNIGYEFIMPHEGMAEDTIIGYEKEQYVYRGKLAVLLFKGIEKCPMVVDMPVAEFKAKLAEQKKQRGRL